MRKKLVEDLAKRIEAKLAELESAQMAGSIHAVIHCDSTGARKVQITVEESWRIPSTTP